jgi:hypothetical protein
VVLAGRGVPDDHRYMRESLIPIVSLALVVVAPAQDTDAPHKGTTSSLEIAGGKVAVHYYPVALPANSLEEEQGFGTVWSMSDREAAVLETEVALMAGRVLIPPGKHRLSTWFKKRGVWELLVFQGSKNYKSGTPYKSLKLQLRHLKKPASELLKIEVVESRGVVRLQLFAGTTRLRVTLEPLEVLRHKGTLAGQEADYEFYKYHADYRIQGRLRNLELIQFGRVRTAGEFGALYDISCKTDGNGIFVICASKSLRQHRELLAVKHKALLANPADAKLKSKVVALQEAVRVQSRMQTNVMVPGEVKKVEKRAKHLRVKPVLDSNGTSFELSFGIRKAKFTLNESQFKKLQWK